MGWDGGDGNSGTVARWMRRYQTDDQRQKAEEGKFVKGEGGGRGGEGRAINSKD